MRLSRLVAVLWVLGATGRALAQEPPAPEPAPPPPAPEAPPAPAEAAPEAPAEPAPAPASERAPGEGAAAVEAAPAVEPLGPAAPVAPQRPPEAKPPAEPPSQRAHWPLTLQGKLGFSVRPESSGGFDEETQAGAELGLSLYLELKREFAVGLEIDRVSLGRGTAINGFDSVTADYSVSSAMLGLRAYPKRSELIDLFVGLQLGVGIQGVSAAGTIGGGGLTPAVAYQCSGSDSPGFQIGGGVGARLMLTPRWGVTAQIGGTGRRLTGDVVEDCVRGIGTATTVEGSLGLGYDFDLDP
jgi:hypothetical protein